MQPVKMTLEGSYWDSYLYEGLLYLFLLDGSVKACNWDDLSTSMSISHSELLAFNIAFQQSSLLYQDHQKRLANDAEVKGVIYNKFSRLNTYDLFVSRQNLDSILHKQQNNIFPFPHNDIEIYNKKIYVSSKSGVYRSTCSKKNVNPISKKIAKLWDCPSLNISASYGNLAIASGCEGIFEFEIESVDYVSLNRFNEPTCISNHHASQVEWNYYSVLGSSHISGGVLAFQNQEEKTPYNFNDDFILPERNYSFSGSVINASSVFGGNGYMWGGKDKIYQSNGNEIKIMHFNPYDKDETFTPLVPIVIQEWKGGLVSAKVTSFGTVLEFENAMVVVRSDGDIQTIVGEPVQWRVFSRSKHYENQLHIIYEDRLDIYSFNHDAFVDQKTKKFGYTYKG